MSFGVTGIHKSEDGQNWIMEFFDARAEWTFEEFVMALKGIGAPLEDGPAAPSDGGARRNFAADATMWVGTGTR